MLRIDGTVVATGSAQAIGSTSSAYITVIHPSPLYYQSFNVSIAAPLSTGASYYLLGTTIGATRKGMVDHHNELVDKAMASGADELSDELLGEQLSVGWHTLNAELTAISDMASRLSDCIVMPSHSVGLHWRNTAPIYNTVHFDVPGGPAAVVSKIPYNEDRRTRAAHVISMFSNTLEELTINQVYNSEMGVSAARILKLANAEATNKIYLATEPNWSTVSANLTNYTHFSPSTIYSSFLQNGGVALIPEIAGQDIGNGLHADGYRAFMPSGSVYGLLNVYKGGCGPWGWGGKCKCKKCEEEASDPVGLLTGAFKYRQTDLTVGSSSYPYQLSFESDYSSAERYKEGSLGLGWSHNWELGAVKVSEPFRGVGSSPIEAVASLVSVFVAMDLYVPDFDSPDFDSLNLMAGSLTSSWWAEQLTFNVVSALTDSGSVEFVKLPDGSYHSCEGDGWSVAEDVGEYTVTSPQKIDYVYNTDGDLQTISFPYGVTISLTYSGGKLTSVGNGMGRDFSLSYTGDRLSSVSDGNGRSVGYSYDLNDRLEAITDPLENDTTFSYDAAGLMKSYFMPENPTVPMVVNTYDTLGRVASQLDMYGRWILRVESSKVTVGGTITQGDVVTLAVRVAGLPTGHKSVSYTVEADDTLADVTTGLRNAVNSDTTLSSVGVTATSSGDVISLEAETAATYRLYTSIKATVTLTPTATTGDILTFTVFNSALSGGQKSINYTVQSGDSTDSIAKGLKNSVNGDSSLAAIGVTAEDLNGPEKGRISLSSTSSNPTTYSSSSSVNSTESIVFDSHSSFYLAGWRTEFKNVLGYSKISNYDRFGNVLREVDELGYETKFFYDGLSRMVGQTLPEGNQVLWTYDGKNNVLTKTQKPKPGSSLDDIVETFTWDATFNKMVTAQDGNGNVTTYFYDPMTGQLLTIERPEVDGEVPTISYQRNARGQVLGKLDETGVQTQFFYDNATEVLSTVVVNTNWRATLSGTVTVSDVLTITVNDAAIGGGLKSKSYTVQMGDGLEDIAIGLASAINGDSELKSLAITARITDTGSALSLSTAAGNTTTFSGSINVGATETISLEEGLELSQLLGYNTWGDVDSFEDARGNTTSYVFDRKRRLAQIENASPFEFVTNLTYDKNDNLLTIERQTRDIAHPWQVHTATYNLANKLTTLTDADSNTTTKLYNQLGQLWKVTDGENKTTEYLYDARTKLQMVKDPSLIVVKACPSAAIRGSAKRSQAGFLKVLPVVVAKV